VKNTRQAAQTAKTQGTDDNFWKTSKVLNLREFGFSTFFSLGSEEGYLAISSSPNLYNILVFLHFVDVTALSNRAQVVEKYVMSLC
jgi:hypothetical protein